MAALTALARGLASIGGATLELAGGNGGVNGGDVHTLAGGNGSVNGGDVYADVGASALAGRKPGVSSGTGV